MAKYLRRHGQEFWEQLAEEFDQLQGVSQREFAELKGVNVATFRHWIYRFRKDRGDPNLCHSWISRHPEADAAHAGFIEVELDVSPVVIVRLGAVVVEFGAVPPPAWVAQLASYGGF